jgi:peptidoglycan/LPS O-acetylase OafA/YrhL
MIQRIQSLYLLLISVCSIVLLFFPIFSLVPDATSSDSSIYMFYMFGFQLIKDGTDSVLVRYWPVTILNFLIMISALLIIFKYKNRPLQLKLTGLLIFLGILMVTLLAYETSQLQIVFGAKHYLMFGWVGSLIILQIVLARLAMVAIKKDNQLVKSADRLR